MMNAPCSLIRLPRRGNLGMAVVLLWLMMIVSAPAVTRVLYLGDSFSKGAFGRTLDAQLRAAGMEVWPAAPR